jgi:lipopolysaccharide export LptBFGC system permease protein LptF
MTRPGTRLRELAQRLCNRTAMERLIDPALADLQHEYKDAARGGQVWRGRWIRLAGCAAFWKLAVIAAARYPLHERIATDERAVWRTVVFSASAAGVLTAILVLPALRTVRHPDVVTTARLMLFLVPQALAVAIPVGLVFGILFGLRDRMATAQARWTIMALGLASSAAAFIIVAWLLPAGNQAFRELAAGRQVMRGLNELTLGELRSADASRTWGGVTPRRQAWEFQLRIALAFAPLALNLLSLGLMTATRRRYGRLAMAIAASTVVFGYYLLLFSGRQDALDGWLSPVLGAWAPNLVCLAIGLTLLRRPGRQTPDCVRST